MKKHIGWLLLLCSLAGNAGAQNPKWYKKARKAQLTLITYAADGSIAGNGNAFYVDEQGTALADYRLFENAARAVAVDADGRERAVTAILGADRLYDVVKFSVANEKKTPALTVAAAPAEADETVYILPPSTAGKAECRTAIVEEVRTVADNYHYYTLSAPAGERQTNCPVMNADGQVIGMMQTPADAAAPRSYAIGAGYGISLHTNVMTAASDVYRAIGIPAALPDNEEQALTFLYMSSPQDTAKYSRYLDEFIRRYPAAVNGYLMRAEFRIAQGRYTEAEADYTAALQTGQKADEVHYARSKQIHTLCQAAAASDQVAAPADWTHDEALAEAQAAYEAQPLPLYLMQQGHCLYALKRYDEAYDRYMRLTDTNLRSAELFLYAVQCRRMAGAPADSLLALADSAVACFTQPYMKQAAPALLSRAGIRAEAGRYRDAVKDLYDYEHLMLNEVNANFYYQRYQFETRCRMLQQALDDIERAIRMAPREPLFVLEKASLHYRVGELAEAIADARHAIRMAPDFADAYRILGVCLKADGQQAEAQQQLKKAAELGDRIAADMLTGE
ncbi:MAG: tetratricopeptide repeat protein [Paraprevotella sp.]|nr:tetratricopeptide repeat protein [Paraprevotella sp.]